MHEIRDTLWHNNHCLQTYRLDHKLINNSHSHTLSWYISLSSQINHRFTTFHHTSALMYKIDFWQNNNINQQYMHTAGSRNNNQSTNSNSFTSDVHKGLPSRERSNDLQNRGIEASGSWSKLRPTPEIRLMYFSRWMKVAVPHRSCTIPRLQ